MRADSSSRQIDRSLEGWLPLVHAVLAFLLVGMVGSFGTLQVAVLALTAGAISYSIARRDSAEPVATDRTATLLKLSFIVVLCGAAFDNRAHHNDILRPSPVALAAFGAIALGLFLRQRAMTALGAQFSIKVLVRSDHQLVETGPYERIRHPNYSGLVLVMIGTVILLESPLALGAVLLLWLPALLLRIRQEESALHDHLGAEYQRYAQRTWRLVPFVF